MRLARLIVIAVAVPLAIDCQVRGASETEESPPPVRTSSRGRTQTFEPVRPISPSPRKRSQRQVRSSPAAESTSATKPAKAKALSSPAPLKEGAAPATISSADIANYDNYPPKLRQVLDLGLSLTSQHLEYKYNSADPASGGMDCSGFVYYVLSQNGLSDVPRDARDQYVWVRNAGTFQAVASRRDDAAELNALAPGDLMFWASADNGSRDPEITLTMLYLGREKDTDQRLIIGAGQGFSYKGQVRSGVGVYEFKLNRERAKGSAEAPPLFIGFGHVPGLGGD